MATAADVINSALGKISVRASEQPIEASELADSMDELNDMMSEWAGSGLPTGFTRVSKANDPITVQDSFLAAIKNNLAIRIATLFQDAPITQALAASADSSFQALMLQIVTVDAPSFPNTLPLGSGNTCGDDGIGGRFFPGVQDGELILEQDGSILLEDV